MFSLSEAGRFTSQFIHFVMNKKVSFADRLRLIQDMLQNLRCHSTPSTRQKAFSIGLFARQPSLDFQLSANLSPAPRGALFLRRIDGDGTSCVYTGEITAPMTIPFDPQTF